MANKSFSINAAIYLKNYTGDIENYKSYYLNLLNGIDFNKFFNNDNAIRFSNIACLLSSLPNVAGIGNVLISNNAYSNISKDNVEDKFVFDKENSVLRFATFDNPLFVTEGKLIVGFYNENYQLTGGSSISVFKVGTIENNIFTLADDFADSGINDFNLNTGSDDRLNDSTAAQNFADYIDTKGLSGTIYTASNETKAIIVPGLELGTVYLIKPQTVIAGYELFEPALFKVPTYRYNENINIKFFLKSIEGIESWKTVFDMMTRAPSGEVNGQGNFSLEVPNFQAVVGYDALKGNDTLSESYYTITQDGKENLVTISNYQNTADLISFDWAASSNKFAIYCATDKGWTNFDISDGIPTYRIGGGTQWKTTTTIKFPSKDYVILWFALRTWQSLSKYEGYFITELFEEFNNDGGQGLACRVQDYSDNEMTVYLYFTHDFPPTEIRYKLIPKI